MSNYRCLSYTGSGSCLRANKKIVPLVVINIKHNIAYATGTTIEWIFGGINLVKIIPKLYSLGKIQLAHSIRSRKIFILNGSPLYKLIKTCPGVTYPPKVIYPINAVVRSLNAEQRSNIIEERSLLLGLDPYGSPNTRKSTEIFFHIIPVSLSKYSSSTSPASLSYSSSSPPPPPPSSSSIFHNTSQSKKKNHGLTVPSVNENTTISSTTNTSTIATTDTNNRNDSQETYITPVGTFDIAIQEEEEEEDWEEGDWEEGDWEEDILLSDKELHETACLSPQSSFSSSPPSPPIFNTKFSLENTLGNYIKEFKKNCPMEMEFKESKLWKYVDRTYFNKEFSTFGIHSRKDIIQDIVNDKKFRLTKIPTPLKCEKEEDNLEVELEEEEEEEEEEESQEMGNCVTAAAVDDDDDDSIFDDLISISPSPSSSPCNSLPLSPLDASTMCSACSTFRKPSYYCKNRKLYYGSSCGNKIIKISWVVDQLDGLAKGTIKPSSINSDLIKNEILFFASNKCID